MKSWLVTAEAPFCGADINYCAFSEDDPTLECDFPYSEIIEELWYNWMLHIDEEEFETEEDREDAWDQAYDDWESGCNVYAEEMSLEDLQDYIPGGAKSKDDLPEIIYDQRNSDSN